MICFLDRDGILNIDYGYVGTIDRFKWNPGIFEVLRILKNKGYSFVLITNQSGIARGYYSIREFYHLSFYMLNYLYDSYGIELEINYCPHAPADSCMCRKPSPSMIQRYGISEMDIMIGDSVSDMESARKAGICHRWLVSEEGKGPFTSHFKTVSDLLASIDLLVPL